VIALPASLEAHRVEVADLDAVCVGHVRYAPIKSVWGVCARVTAGVFGHWMIGYLAHNHGGLVREVRGAAVQGRDVRFVSLLTMGESWHSNHHAFPGSAKLGSPPTSSIRGGG
jgi:fatty-acid desaturase